MFINLFILQYLILKIIKNNFNFFLFKIINFFVLIFNLNKNFSNKKL